MKKEYYHISSSGLEKNSIFRNRAEFISGMNDIAICAAKFEISILCFCLMSNHFHFVVSGNQEECRTFAEEYKRMCAIRMRQFSGEVKGLKDTRIQLDLIDSQEYLENAIAYVLRNPLAAKIMVMPYHYEWSSADLYFCGETKAVGEYLSEMSDRKRYRMLKSRIELPKHYFINAEGLIHPSCYVNIACVESIFRFPARLMALMARKIENDIEVRMGIADHITMTDEELMTQTRELTKITFQKESIFQLTMDERLRLCLMLKTNFQAGAKQIARITRLPVEIIQKVI